MTFNLKNEEKNREDEWDDVKFVAKFLADVIRITELALRIGLALFVFLAWLGCWIGMFEYSGLNPMHGLIVGLLTFVLTLWVRKKIAGRVW